MAQAYRNTRLFVVPESSEGTPVSPTSGGQALPVQPDLTMSPGVETLESAELRGSIGASKPIRGLENPNGSFSVYLKSSGTPGSPNDADLLTASVFGAKEVEATEYDTIAGSTAGTSSTRATLVVDSGEGAQFARGQGVLIQDGANGYSLRAIRSIAGDVLSLNYNLDAAPASGVNLGKSVFYYPSNSGHQPLSIWAYMANGGAVQMVSGSQVSEMSLEASANGLVNTSYTFEGDLFHHNPIEVTATSNDIDFTDDGGAVSATLEVGFFRSPKEAADALAAAMTAASVNTITVEYQNLGADKGKFVVSSDGTTFDVDWASTVDTLGALYGFTADDSGSTSYTSDSAMDLSSPFTPAVDDSDPLTARFQEILLGGFDDFACIQDGVQSLNFSISTEKPRPGNICAESGRGTSFPNGRTVTVDISAIVAQYDMQEFQNLLDNETIEFQYSFGSKTSGNWNPGKCGVLYISDAVVSNYELADSDGVLSMNITLTAHVDADSNGEVYLSFL